MVGDSPSAALATCPLTVSGCVRVLSRSTYPRTRVTPAEIIDRLRGLCESPHHVFWPDDISLVEPGLLEADSLTGHGQITDAHLLALTVRRGGQLVTFDRSIPMSAVRGAKPEHLLVLKPTLTAM